jgi:hypothetical protein
MRILSQRAATSPRGLGESKKAGSHKKHKKTRKEGSQAEAEWMPSGSGIESATSFFLLWLFVLFVATVFDRELPRR